MTQEDTEESLHLQPESNANTSLCQNPPSLSRSAATTTNTWPHNTIFPFGWVTLTYKCKTILPEIVCVNKKKKKRNTQKPLLLKSNFCNKKKISSTLKEKSQICRPENPEPIKQSAPIPWHSASLISRRTRTSLLFRSVPRFSFVSVCKAILDIAHGLRSSSAGTRHKNCWQESPRCCVCRPHGELLPQTCAARHG